MPTAEEVATFLAYEFLKRGNYSASAGPVEVAVLAQALPAAAEQEEREYFEGTDVFASLAVQSVGFEEGVDDPIVHIYLTRGSVRLMNSLPEEIDGVPLQAHKMGPVIVRPEMAGTVTNRANFFERNNRVCCGSSCAPTSENCSGTFGALIRKNNNSRQLYLLSNNHVFAGCNHVPKDQPILSPSSNDGRADIRAPGEIGRHAEIYELRSGNPGFVEPCEADLALARATDPAAVSSWQGDSVNGYDTPARTQSPISRMRVKKVGRTTALTYGTLQAKIPTPAALPYTSKHFKSVVWFKNVWTVRADSGGVFALPGDSGSLVVTEDGTRAVGVLFAANRSGEYGWIIPMACVETAFGGLRLVGGHGIEG
jgi:hypothetical protein